MYRMTVRPATRRVTANLPNDVLDEALRATGKGITETLVAGLEKLARVRAQHAVLALRGTMQLDVDIEGSRGRRRR